MKWGWKSEKTGKKLYMFGKCIYEKKPTRLERYINESQIIQNNIYIPASVHHAAVFEKYRNCNAGKDLVLLAAGPTLDSYTPMPGAIHLGVNRVYQAKHIALDYLMAIDAFFTPDEEIESYRPELCAKLFGFNYQTLHKRISESLISKTGAERFYYHSIPYGVAPVFPSSLAHSPLIVMESVVTAAFQFALWTGPKRIYLVGCDCSSSGYFSAQKSGIPQKLSSRKIIHSWEILKEFADNVYPDIEIVSINPVGLRGLFTDMKMENGTLSLLNNEEL